jgi:cardiolipin synthase (CMP-forming)
MIPNVLTVFRCVAVILIAVALGWPWGALTTFALVMFLLAAISDFLDGFIARSFNMTTPFGRMLDSIADKLLVGVTLLMLCAEGSIYGVHAWAAALILFREIAISGLREHLAPKGIVVPASMFGKWKTTMQLVAITVLIGAPISPFPYWTAIWGLAILWVAVVMTVASGVEYVLQTRAHWGDTTPEPRTAKEGQ